MADSVLPGVSSVISQDITQNIDPRLTTMFMKPEGMVGVENTFTHFVEPVRPPAQSDHDYYFEIPNVGSSFLDLKNTEMYVRGSLKRKTGGTDLTDLEDVVLTNNALHSLWESVTIYIGRNQEEIYVANHPYKAFVRQLQGNDYFSERRNVGFLPELVNPLFKNHIEMGEARKEWTMKSKSVEFMGPVLLDLFNTDGYLLPGCPLRIKYRKSRDSFYVVSSPDNADVEYNFVIDKIGLYVPCINISPQLAPLLHMQTDQAPARYEFEGLDMKQFAVPKGTIVRKFSRVYEGHLPQKIMVAFFKETSFSGQRDESPLVTYPVDMRYIKLSLNGVAVREMRTNFKEGLYMESYRRFIDWMEASDKSRSISYDVYTQGYRYLCFDLMENCPSGAPCAEEMLTQGFLDISIQLGAGLDESCVMAVFSLAPETLEITKDRVARHLRTVV